MTDKVLVNANEIPELALDFMNHDHAEAVQLANALYSALAEAPAESIDELLDQLYLHNVEHFAREEQHMQEYHFPPYPMHKGEHDRVLAEMQAVISYWKESRDKGALENYLQNTFVQWLHGHMMTMDRVTAMFVAGQMSTSD